MRLLLVTVVLLLAGCGGEDATSTAVDPGPVDLVELGPGSGCGDAFFWATTPDDRVAVTVTLDVRDRSTTEETTLSYDVGDPAVTVKVLRGEKLSTTFCTDVLTGDPIQRETDASTGHAEVRLDPGRPDMMGCGTTSGSLTLSGLTGDGLSFADVTVDSDMIGCYAG
jgi:hypothetical protein